MGHESCGACGFDGELMSDAQVLDEIEALGPAWREILDEAGDDVDRRPEPETWSALEYAAHSRDITALHNFLVEAALESDEPVLPEVDGAGLIDDAAAGYAALDPGVVAEELEFETGGLAARAAAVDRSAWSRGITIGTARQDIRAVLEHGLHDSHHHLVDVRRGLAQLRAAGG